MSSVVALSASSVSIPAAPGRSRNYLLVGIAVVVLVAASAAALYFMRSGSGARRISSLALPALRQRYCGSKQPVPERRPERKLD